MMDTPIASPHPDHDLLKIALESIKLPVLLLCFEDGRTLFCNRAFQSAYGSSAAFLRLPMIRANEGPQNAIGPEFTLEEVLKRIDDLGETDFEAEFGGEQRRSVCLSLRALYCNQEKLVLLTAEDITRHKDAERKAFDQHARMRWSVTTGITELEEANRDLQNEIAGREQVEAALHESETALLRSREDLRHLSASLMNAQDAERRRVSRELHDDLSQKMAKLQFDAEVLEQQVPFEDIEAAKQRLRDVGQQAAGISDDLRRVAHQLHPATLDHLGLSIAVKSYTEEFSRSTAIRVKYTSISVPRNIPIEVASGLFRIVQEALRNVAKHASNASIEIVLAGVTGGLSLFIRDNGRGFDLEVARNKGGLGLISIEERVRLLDGKLSIETALGTGVLLVIQCPLASRVA